jgi:O-antigen/teichoic acid export membrane protein
MYCTNGSAQVLEGDTPEEANMSSHNTEGEGSPRATPKEVVLKRSLRSNVAWTLAGNLTYTGCQWGMSIALAKLSTPESLGQFSLGFSIAAPIFMAGSLQLRGVQATDAKRDYKFSTYLSLRLCTSFLALSLICILCCWSWINGSYTTATALTVFLIGLAKTSESISDIFFGYMQQNEQMDRIAKSAIAKGLLSLTTLSLAMYVTGSIVLACAALLLSWITVLLLIDIRNGRSVREAHGGENILSISKDTGEIKRLFKLTFPLGLMLLLISLSPVLPRFYLASNRNLHDLGIYAALSYIMMAGQTVVSAVGQAASPRMAQRYAAQDLSGYLKLLSVFVALGGFIGVIGVAVAMVFGTELLTLMYSAEYASYKGALVIIMAAAGLQYVATFIEYGVTAARVFKQQLFPASVALAITAATSITLIPTLGIQGAAWAVLAGQVATIFGRCTVLLMAVRSLQRAKRTSAQCSL